jgi:hypothetical protein
MVCMQELEDQVFDVLLLWASPFTGNPESYLSQIQDWTSELRFVSRTTYRLHVLVVNIYSLVITVCTIF